MARLPRLDMPGVAQYMAQRGNDRSPCFADDADYPHYRQELGEATLRHDCLVHAYVLMTNHVLLLVTPMATGGVSRMMQAIGRRYVGCFNARYGRTGTLWEGRFKSALVDSERFVLPCYRDIELNPVRATMVGSPGDYRWLATPTTRTAPTNRASRRIRPTCNTVRMTLPAKGLIANCLPTTSPRRTRKAFDCRRISRKLAESTDSKSRSRR
jgi:REP element-mobilizing transposase RayT